MAKRSKDRIAEGLAAFREAVPILMELRGIKSEAELARMVKRRMASGPSPKTINNALAGRHDAQISTLQAIADTLDCPLWVLFLVGRQPADLEIPTSERLVAMMTNYLQCDAEGRHHVESLAAAFAAKSKK